MRTLTYPSSRRLAFTLIELLVVISIISLLIAVLLPALQNARIAGQKASSLSSIRQVSIALYAYATDENQSMPFMQQKRVQESTGDIVDVRFGDNWATALHTMGYVSSLETFWSPGREQSQASGIEDVRSEWAVRPNPYSYECVGYGLNTGVGGSTEYDFLFNNGHAPLRLDEAGAPPQAEMILLAETFSSHNSIGSINGYYAAYPTKYNNGSYSRLFNYNGGIVRSYVDGHANAAGQGAPDAISGRVHRVSNGLAAPVDSREIGWSVSATPTGDVYPGSYAGYWTFNSHTDGWEHTPWFSNWRTNWTDGLRP